MRKNVNFLLNIVKLTLLDSLFWRSRGGRLHQLGGWIKAILLTLGSRPAQRGWDWEWDWHQTWLQEQHSASLLLWPGQPQGSGKAHLFFLFSGRVFLADAEGSVQTHIDGWGKQFCFFIFFFIWASSDTIYVVQNANEHVLFSGWTSSSIR